MSRSNSPTELADILADLYIGSRTTVWHYNAVLDYVAYIIKARIACRKTADNRVPILFLKLDASCTH